MSILGNVISTAPGTTVIAPKASWELISTGITKTVPGDTITAPKASSLPILEGPTKTLPVLITVVPNISPEIILEPTYGTGNFILSCLEHFPKIRKIYGIEYHKEYEWIFKTSLLSFRISLEHFFFAKNTVAPPQNGSI